MKIPSYNFMYRKYKKKCTRFIAKPGEIQDEITLSVDIYNI